MAVKTFTIYRMGEKPSRRRDHDVRFLRDEIERLRKERNELRDKAGRAEANVEQLRITCCSGLGCGAAGRGPWCGTDCWE